MSLTTAKQMADSGKGNTPYKVSGKTPNELDNSTKYAKAAEKVVDTISKGIDWLSTPKMPDSYLAHGGVGPNGLSGSPENTLASAFSNTGKAIGDWLDRLANEDSSDSPGSGRGTGSGAPGGAPSGSGFGSYQDVMDLVNQTADANNAWSAKQAQLDREWQEYMSNTAHQREVADLKAAGLNPVLSAGGNGASTPSGAMGQTDTSNTRLIGEIAMSALDAMSMTAVSYAGAGKKTSNKGEISLLNRFSNAYASNNLVKKVTDTAMNTAASIARLGLVKALF